MHRRNQPSEKALLFATISVIQTGYIEQNEVPFLLFVLLNAC